jgi:hypothetical protein
MTHFPNPYPIYEANPTIWLFREDPPAYYTGGLNPAFLNEISEMLRQARQRTTFRLQIPDRPAYGRRTRRRTTPREEVVVQVKEKALK